MNRTLRTVLLTLLCVPASGVGIVLGFVVGCVIAMVLQGIFAPGAGYDHYSVGTPVGNVVILGPVAIGAAVPWSILGWYMLRTFGREDRPKDKAAVESRLEQGIEEERGEAQLSR